MAKIKHSLKHQRPAIKAMDPADITTAELVLLGLVVFANVILAFFF